MKNGDDFIWVKQLRNGSHRAFNSLYHRYFQKLYGFCLKITGNKLDAEEIVQEVFGKIWEMRNDLDPERNFGSLIFTIGKHKIYNKTRHRIYDIAYQNYIKTHTVIAEEFTDQEIFFNEAVFIIDKAITVLPEKRREIFIMSRLEGLSNKEIARKLNTSLSNIENHINKALKSIKLHMSENEMMILLLLFIYAN